MCRCLHRKSAYPVGCGSPWPPVRVALPRTLRGPSSRPVCGTLAARCAGLVRELVYDVGATSPVPRGGLGHPTGARDGRGSGHTFRPCGAGGGGGLPLPGRRATTVRPPGGAGAGPGPGAVALRGRGACTAGCRLPTQQSARPGGEHPLPARGEGLTPSRVRAPPAPRRRPRPRGLTTAATDRPPADCRPRARPSARGPSPQARKPAATMCNPRQADRRCQTPLSRVRHRRTRPRGLTTVAAESLPADCRPCARPSARPGAQDHPSPQARRTSRDGVPARRLPAS